MGPAEDPSFDSPALSLPQSDEAPNVFFSKAWPTHILPIVTAALLLSGLVLRLRGYLTAPISLWEDEAAWAVRLIEGQLPWTSIRPPGFIAVSKAFVALFGSREAALRALPWLCGLGTLVMAPLLAKRLWSTPAARLLFVAVIALHPGAVDLAKEFKPYSVSLALHMGLMLLALTYTQARSNRSLAGLMVLSFVSSLFAQDAIFIYPAVFGVVLLEAIRARHFRHVVVIGSVAVCTLALLAAQYAFIWRAGLRGRHANDTAADYWGPKYGVFFTEVRRPGLSRLDWTASRLAATAAMPGMRRERWQNEHLSSAEVRELRYVDAHVWRVLACLGIVVLSAQKRDTLKTVLLLMLPPFVWLVCNRLGFWPFGPFRTNLFALLYAAGLAASAFDLGPTKRTPWDLMPTGVLVLAPFLLLSRDLGASKSSSLTLNSSFVPAMRAIATLRGSEPSRGKPRLFLDRSACTPWRYYTQHHSGNRVTRRKLADLETRCVGKLPILLRNVQRALRHPQDRAYVLASEPLEVLSLLGKLPSDLAVDAQVVLGENEQLVLRLKRQRRGRAR